MRKSGRSPRRHGVRRKRSCWSPASGTAVAADYAAYVDSASKPASHDSRVRIGRFAPSNPHSSNLRADSAARASCYSSVVLFLPTQLTGTAIAARWSISCVPGRRATRLEFVGIVSSFRAHLGDAGCRRGRELRAGQAAPLARAARVVFRAGARSQPQFGDAAEFLRRYGCCFPLVPRRLRSCCVKATSCSRPSNRNGADSPQAFFPCVHAARSATGRGETLLAQHRATGVLSASLHGGLRPPLATAVGHLAALVLGLFARRRPALRCWNFDTLRPASFRELLALYNPYNYRHVKVVGYNNGVNHFGHRYPGKTVVSTVHCNRIVRAGPDSIKADCGATVRKALRFPAPAEARNSTSSRTTPTSAWGPPSSFRFMAPPRTSPASRDTITKVVLYDPCPRPTDRGDARRAGLPRARLQHAIRRAAAAALRPRQARVARTTSTGRNWSTPAATSFSAPCGMTGPANVEIRKSSASSNKVQVYTLLQRAGRVAVAGAGAAARRAGPAVGPARRESGHLVPDARLDAAPRLARRAVLHGGGVRDVLGRATPHCRSARSSSATSAGTDCRTRPSATTIASRRTCSCSADTGPRSRRTSSRTFAVVRANPGKHSSVSPS